MENQILNFCYLQKGHPILLLYHPKKNDDAGIKKIAPYFVVLAP